jgi:hypothetical protein
VLVDGLSRRELHRRAVLALRDANTIAQHRVFDFADWPTTPALFPMLLVSAQKERKVAIFPGQLQFNTTMTLVVVGRLVGNLPDPLGDLLEVLSEQIENTILLHPFLQPSIQEYRVVECENTVRADGKQHIGEASAIFEVVVFQDYGVRGVPLADIAATGTIVGGTGTPEPIIDVTLLPVVPTIP